MNINGTIHTQCYIKLHSVSCQATYQYHAPDSQSDKIVVYVYCIVYTCITSTRHLYNIVIFSVVYVVYMYIIVIAEDVILYIWPLVANTPNTLNPWPYCKI